MILLHVIKDTVLFIFCFLLGFGTTNASSNLFGTQQNTGTNLFGTSTGTSTFGQGNKSSGFSFGTTSGTNLFGQPQQNAQQTTPFGPTNTTTNTNLFGTTTGKLQILIDVYIIRMK